MRLNYGQMQPLRNVGFPVPSEQEATPAAAPMMGGGMFGRRRNNRGQMIAGVLGDALSRLSGGQALYLPTLLQQRQQEQSDARQQQQRELEALAPQRMTVAGNLIEYSPQTGQTRTLFSAPREPQTFEDNSGNRWTMGPDGQPRLAFYDPTPRFDSTVTVNDRGEQVLVRTPRPNGFNPDGTARNAAPSNGVPDTLPPDFDFGAAARPTAATATASGVPGILQRALSSRRISRAEYNQAARQLGPNGRTAMDGWLRASGVTVLEGR